ncbi:hypothetical protein [Kitasatospora sp. NPDC001527]|uniref:hypothetical protein n=1 Tax=Kitasatospora sp. NPDC001527 TaxID=3154519 RepID=UPI00331E72F3
MRRRLHAAPEQVRGGLRPGEEQVYGELLGTIGVFDLPRRLDARERAIAEHLRAAVRAMGGVASGHAALLARRLAAGEPADAFGTLAHSGPRAGGGRPTAYWAALVAGGELLDTANGDTHGGVAPALAECRRRLADRVRQSGPPPSGVGPPSQAAGPDA